MTTAQLLLWAKAHRYPQLVLSGKDRVHAGQGCWHFFVENASRERKDQAAKRIEMWTAREEGKVEVTR